MINDSNLRIVYAENPIRSMTLETDVMRCSPMRRAEHNDMMF